jgi:hypothetical protein
MTLDDLKILIIQTEINELGTFLSENRNEIKLLFSNSSTTIENTNTCIQILSYLHKQSKQVKSIKDVQFLFSLLAFYFKAASKAPYITTCINNLTDSILKFRLQAWHQYKTYTKAVSHANRFEAYLGKLSLAVSDESEEYIDEVLQDLHSYFTEYNYIVGFQELFNDFSLLTKYPILSEYKKRRSSLDYKIELHETANKIYCPSTFAEELFNTKFINYIRNHPQTEWNQVLLGYDKFLVRSEVIKFGQANFDNDYKKLNPAQVVKLYCYLNMRKHYYSSLYLFERCLWLKKIISMEGCAKFIDIGCGPATSGIALTDYLNADELSLKQFDYFGVDSYQSMLDAASDLMNNDVYENCRYQQYVKSIKSIDVNNLSNANSILLNACYLFASPSLEIDDLVLDVNNLLETNNTKPRFLFFQNTIEPNKNIKYESFKNKLIAHEVLLSEKVTIKYNNQRNSRYPPVSENVYFEVLKF